MSLSPQQFEEFLASSGHADAVYSSMEDDDLARLPLTVLDALNKTDTPPRYSVWLKCTITSIARRERGNQCFKNGEYFRALKIYNMAISFAPNNSRDQVLAYSNRSALLYRINEYKACLKDIDTCFKLGADFIADKLNKNKNKCIKHLQKNKGDLSFLTEDIFKFKGIVNSDIPCASTDIEVRFDSGVPKVIAKKNIEIGTIVAIETAYVSILNSSHHFVSCYHCHRMSKNLIPCPKCPIAMFCNEECRKQCMKDVHRTECYFALYNEDSPNVKQHEKLVFKAVLKMKQHAASWNDFIELSNNTGNLKLKSSSSKEVYNANDKYSILNFKEMSEPKYGPMFNFSYICALFIQFLLSEPTFFPANPEEKNAALEAVARLMMKLYLHLNTLDVSNSIKDINKNVIPIFSNYAFFTFIGQLKHSCVANLLTVGLGNKIAVVAIKQIVKGDDLTISYIQHDHNVTQKVEVGIALYRRSISCDCHVCRGTTVVQRLNSRQLKLFHDWVLTMKVMDGNVSLDPRVSPPSPHTKMTIIINTMKELRNVPYSAEFGIVLIALIKCLQVHQHFHTDNFFPYWLNSVTVIDWLLQ